MPGNVPISSPSYRQLVKCTVVKPDLSPKVLRIFTKVSSVQARLLLKDLRILPEVHQTINQSSSAMSYLIEMII